MQKTTSEKSTGQKPLEATPLPEGTLSKYPWLTFLLPFLVYMLGNTLMPTSREEPAVVLGLKIAYSYYPLVYALKIILTLIAMVFVFRGYRTFPFRVSPWAFVVGIVGVVVWIGIWKLGMEQKVLPAIGLGGFVSTGERSAFNPLKELADNPARAYIFLGIRFLGLVLVVPIIEEFFLRGFVMRFAMENEWWKVPFGKATTLAIILGTAVPMMMHPAELFSALVWFSMVTWLMLKTKNIWDCIIAHAVTNLLLGIYVVWFNEWALM